MAKMSTPNDFPDMHKSEEEKNEDLIEANLIALFEEGFRTFAQDGKFHFRDGADCEKKFHEWTVQSFELSTVGWPTAQKVFQKVVEKYKALGWVVESGSGLDPYLPYPSYLIFKKS